MMSVFLGRMASIGALISAVCIAACASGQPPAARYVIATDDDAAFVVRESQGRAAVVLRWDAPVGARLVAGSCDARGSCEALLQASSTSGVVEYICDGRPSCTEVFRSQNSAATAVIMASRVVTFFEDGSTCVFHKEKKPAPLCKSILDYEPILAVVKDGKVGVLAAEHDGDSGAYFEVNVEPASLTAKQVFTYARLGDVRVLALFRDSAIVDNGAGTRVCVAPLQGPRSRGIRVVPPVDSVVCSDSKSALLSWDDKLTAVGDDGTTGQVAYIEGVVGCATFGESTHVYTSSSGSSGTDRIRVHSILRHDRWPAADCGLEPSRIKN